MTEIFRRLTWPALKEYMKDKPIPRSESIVNKDMFAEIIFNSSYITILCLAILFFEPLHKIFGTSDITYLRSAVFATFMMAITFNGFNARSTHFNPLKGISKNKNFIIVMLGIICLQFFFVTFGGEILSVTPLNPKTWGWCTLLAFLVIPLESIRNFLFLCFSNKK